MKKILLILGVYVAINSTIAQNVASEIMLKSGITEQIKQIDALVEVEIGKKANRMENKEDFERFSSIMRNSFNSSIIEKYIKEYFEQKVSQDSLKKAIKLYENPLVKKMMELELASGDPANQQAQMLFYQELQNTPPAENRMGLITRLNNAFNSAEMMIMIMENMAIGMAKGVNTLQPEDKQIPEQELLASIRNTFPKNIKEIIESNLTTASLYTYHTVTDEELNKYVKMWESPLGQYYGKHLILAYDYSFTQVGGGFGKNIENINRNGQR